MLSHLRVFSNMQAVSESLLKVIVELQQLPALQGSTLGGGTNLAVRYGHRRSYDIDLFFPDIIGRNGYEAILKEVSAFYKGAIFGVDYPCNINDQFMFLRFYVRQVDEAVKVEVLQNMQTYDTPEMINGVSLMSEQDIGMLKLITVSNRANQKDVYDLDYITDRLPLSYLMAKLAGKNKLYSEEHHKSIFKLDDEYSPVDEPELLLKFDMVGHGNLARPGHSNPRVDLLEDSKKWLVARSSWRRKVRAYFTEIGRDFPSTNPQ